MESDPDFPFILIAPQCPAGTYWRAEPLLSLVDDATARFRIDPDMHFSPARFLGRLRYRA